ncbi:hypothetical protein ACOSQ3_027611 [Xanthoceras sorbifolium]
MARIGCTWAMVQVYLYPLLVIMPFIVLYILWSLKIYCTYHISQKHSLSVSKFVRDNNVFLESHPLFYLVKDQATKRVLLRGVLKNGLYVFNLPINTSRAISPSPHPSKHSALSASVAVPSYAQDCFAFSS